ncbi:MAG: pyridoxamine 5'-phosphate oxidase family protein [Chloroflexi bacterium]|nr:pyridoxamine 5'-phosphate oxidase family protein [Chloroflexota bacterium]
MAAAISERELQTVRSFLEVTSTLALATVNADGSAQIAPLFFVADAALNLYWLSAPTSIHSVNLSARPAVAAAVYPEVWAWEQIRGVQIEGQAGAVNDSEASAAALRLYRAKFTLPAALNAQIAASTVYKLTPRWLRWLDNGVRFGYKAQGEINT